VKIPVILDTDIGTNIDDALALAYLLKQPRCELLGITTVTHRARERAQIADALCRAFGRDDVPIFCGADQPLHALQQQTEAPQQTILKHWPHRKDFQPDRAVDFLRQTIRSRPGKITLLTIGPLTNIAKLFQADPEIPQLIHQHVMMGGLYLHRVPGYGPTERNAGTDPDASEIVFTADLPFLQCVGLDVTTRCKMLVDECWEKFKQGPFKIVGEMAEIWLQKRSDIIFHDPLAAACIFEPDLCAYKKGLVRVELQDRQNLGKTNFTTQDKHKPHQVAVDVNVDAFFKHYFNVCSTD